MSQLENVYDAAVGRQEKIKGGGLATNGSFNTKVLLEGVEQAASTDYYYRIPTAGSNTLHIVLKPSAVSGTIAVTAYATLSDGITQKGAASTLTVPSGTTQVVDAITTLAGERFWVLKIAVSAASAVTFSQAEFTTL